MTTTKSASLIASSRSVVAQTQPGRPLSRIIRWPNASIRRSFSSVGLIRANSLSMRDGVAIISDIRVLQNTTLPAPIIAILRGMGLLLVIHRFNSTTVWQRDRAQAFIQRRRRPAGRSRDARSASLTRRAGGCAGEQALFGRSLAANVRAPAPAGFGGAGARHLRSAVDAPAAARAVRPATGAPERGERPPATGDSPIGRSA